MEAADVIGQAPCGFGDQGGSNVGARVCDHVHRESRELPLLQQQDVRKGLVDARRIGDLAACEHGVELVGDTKLNGGRLLVDPVGLLPVGTKVEVWIRGVENEGEGPSLPAQVWRSSCRRKSSMAALSRTPLNPVFNPAALPGGRRTPSPTADCCIDSAVLRFIAVAKLETEG